ncbi:uncharacterized protein [Narcine bancroftii]|uniref:uncharacterized protein isoform X2 n=1 Tax=Narcine bancroftii TaxID=1343680 RepID=UPI003831890A
MVNTCFKQASIILVPWLNDFWPVVFTSTVIKCFERLVMKHISSCLSGDMDPFQFTNHRNMSMVDAISLAPRKAFEHLDSKDAYIRMLFIDYSSAFNTIIPSKLISKLQDLGVNTQLCNWIMDFLTSRPQSVKTGVLPYRLRDREQLRKRKMEALEQKNSQEKTKTKRRKGKACGKSSKPTKEPEPKPDPKYNPQPEPCQEQKEEAKDKMPQLSPECEIPAPLQKIPSLSITEDLATSTDELEKIKLASLKIPEILPLQAKDMPGEEASSEEQIVLSM